MTILHRLLGSAFDQCSDRCGWIAAIIAALAYGTFGVPIKETVSIDVHPLVLQSYKTVTMFVLSWTVVLMGESVRFTPWGILSGLLWVLGGTGGIFAIRAAGMSVAVGTWSSCMVIINFLVGILMFQEPVSSIPTTFAAFVLLGLGLVGMSIYSAPPINNNSHKDHSNNPLMDSDIPMHEITPRMTPLRTRSYHESDSSQTDYDPLRDSTPTHQGDGLWQRDGKKGRSSLFTKRQLGILGAVINGVLTGSSLVPIHYAKKQGFGGAAYMLSFASGALLCNILILLVWFIGKMVMSRTETRGLNILAQTYESMPSIYFKQLWAPGFSAGVLLTVAMFGSIMAVTYLGQGVGNSIIQSKILISGLWGIFWYKEISGGLTITKWFASAGLAVSGIIWLSYERIHATAGLH